MDVPCGHLLWRTWVCPATQILQEDKGSNGGPRDSRMSPLEEGAKDVASEPASRIQKGQPDGFDALLEKGKASALQKIHLLRRIR